jgi:predicted DNA-binding transcriptional regulator YafY
VAVAVGLRAAAGAAIVGIEDSAVRALAKVEQTLPFRLRRRVSALDAAVVSLRRAHTSEGVVDPEVLSVLALACQSHEPVRFRYRRRDGDDSRRWVEPHQLLSAGRRWYLIAWDLRRSDWRTFRLDRLGEVQLAGGRFAPRDIPGGDAAAFLATSVASIAPEIEATVTAQAPYQQVAEALSWVEHTLVDDQADACTIRLRANRLDSLVMALARVALSARVRVIEPGIVADELNVLTERLEQG